MAADPTMATGPFLEANMAPVRAPLVIEFHGSSFPLILTMLQSIMEKRPPQTAKLPPSCGALVLIAVKLPRSRWFTPTGEFLNPLMAWKMPPPIAPMVKAPPQSSTILQGQGSRAYSSILQIGRAHV